MDYILYNLLAIFSIWLMFHLDFKRKEEVKKEEQKQMEMQPLAKPLVKTFVKPLSKKQI